MKREPLSAYEKNQETMEERVKRLEEELSDCKLQNHLLKEENIDMQDVIENLQDEVENQTQRKRKKARIDETREMVQPTLPERQFPGQRNRTRPRGDWLTSTRNARLKRTRDLNQSIQQFTLNQDLIPCFILM